MCINIFFFLLANKCYVKHCFALVTVFNMLLIGVFDYAWFISLGSFVSLWKVNVVSKEIVLKRRFH